MFRVLALLIATSWFTNCLGQITYLRISPQTTLIQHVGLSSITIEYSPPGIHERKIMSDLVPYGRIWRAGAHESAKITFSDSVAIHGTTLPAGTYAVYAIPEATYWTSIIHKNDAHWGDGRTNYPEREDALRFSTKVNPAPTFTEIFTIEFDSITHNAAVMVWRWEHSKISFALEVKMRSKMLTYIEQRLTHQATEMMYSKAARHLQEESIHHANLSNELAAKERKDKFVRMNEKLLKNGSLN